MHGWELSKNAKYVDSSGKVTVLSSYWHSDKAHVKYMEFHGKFSTEFHGGLGHQFPFNSLEISWKGRVITSFCRYYGDCIACVCTIFSVWRNSEHVDFIGCKTPEQVSVIGVVIGFEKPTDVVGELLEPHQIVTGRLRQWKVPIYQRWRWGYTGYCYIPGGDSFRLKYKINHNINT